MRAARWCAAALAVAAVALAIPPDASSAPATSAEVRTLAREALRDRAALARLRAVDRVDGRRVDLSRALDTRQQGELRARLEMLASGAPATGAAAEARREAAEVLEQRKYKRSSLPQPLRRPFERLGEVLQDIYDWLVDRVPGGDFGLGTLLAAIVLGIGAFLASRVVRRQVEEEHASATAARRTGEDPRTLERDADVAERGGDHETAVRLRFRAGLLRLDARGAIELRPGLTTGAIARQLRSAAFDEVAMAFDEIAYGGREATAQDAASAKSGWKRVLSEHRDRPALREAA